MSESVHEMMARFGGYPQPKPKTRVIAVEVRAEQNGCVTCSGTGKVPGGTAWEEPGFISCPACGWEKDEEAEVVA